MTKFAQYDVLWSPSNPNKFIKFDIGDGNNDINLYQVLDPVRKIFIFNFHLVNICVLNLFFFDNLNLFFQIYTFGYSDYHTGSGSS